MELILKAKDIRVEFKGRDVLDIDNLEVYDYDRIGLVGANGAGKSTLFKVLLGELTPLGCKMNRLGELAYIPQLDEVTLQEEKDFALVGKLGVKQLDIQTLQLSFPVDPHRSITLFFLVLPIQLQDLKSLYFLQLRLSGLLLK